MKELLLSAWKMLREHPILLLPYCCAQLSAILIGKAPVLIAEHAMFSPSARQSVLGFSSPMYADPSEAQRIALRYSIPFSIVAHYVNICLLVYALVVTARLVHLLLEKRAVGTDEALRVLPRVLRAILVFALKFAICMMVAAGLAGMLIALFPVDTVASHHVAFGTLSQVFVVACMVAIAWIFAPMALNLLRPKELLPKSKNTTETARRVGMIVAAVSSIEGLAYNALRFHIRVSGAWQGHAVGAVATLVVNAPLAILFVGLALLSIRRDDVPIPVLGITLAAQDPAPEVDP